jgi:hypothetical protein
MCGLHNILRKPKSGIEDVKFSREARSPERGPANRQPKAMSCAVGAS